MVKKNHFFVLVVLIFMLCSCQVASSETPVVATESPTATVITTAPTPTQVPDLPKSPCNKVMTTDQFFIEYLNQMATFKGVYQNGSVYAFLVGDDLVCTTRPGGSYSNDEELMIYQDTIMPNGETRVEANPVFDEYFNGLIGFSGIVTNQLVSPDLTGNWILHNTNPVTINPRPADCEVLTDETVKQFTGKTVTIVSVDNFWDTEEYWRKVVFSFEEKNYCYDSAYYYYNLTVTDITGAAVSAKDPSWTGNTWFMQGVEAKIGFHPAEFTDNVTKEEFVKDIMDIYVGEYTENVDFGDPMVLEFMSRDGYYKSVFWQQNKGWYLLVNSVLPDQVNPGYLISPKEYINGGELEVGTVLGTIDGNPVTVTGMQCAINFVNDGLIQSVDYSWLDSSSSGELLNGDFGPYRDTYVYMVENNGNHQIVTYFHVPSECPE